MLAYLVLAGRNGAPVDPGLLARFEVDDPPGAPFRSTERIVWRNLDGSIVFFGWQARTEFAGIRSHWEVDACGLTAFSGHCWPRERGWAHGTNQSWAAQLRSYLSEPANPVAMRESLFGQFTVLSFPFAGEGTAMPDWVSLDQLFVADGAEVTAVSNRAGFCAQAVVGMGETPQRSLTGAGWLVCEGWILDQESGYWDVERPPAGSIVTFEAGRGARVVEPAHSPLFPPEPETPPPSYVDLLDENEHLLRATFRTIANLPIDDLILSLSGGKDSRTLLAIILSEGLRDRFRFVTNGSPERADAIAAKAIADRFGLNWTLEDSSTRSPELELENALLHTGRTEGMTSAWGSFMPPVETPAASVSGVGGEGLRWGYVSSSAVHAQTIDDVRAALRRTRPIDPLRVLRPDARTYYQSWVDDWVDQQVASGIPLKSIAPLYIQEPLLHSRNGPDYAWSQRLRLTPFVTPECLRTNHRLAVDRAPDARFHLDLQRRCSIELSKMPRAEEVWPEAAYDQLPDAADYRRIEPVNSTNLDGRTWRQKRYADYLPSIESILLDPNNPLHELLDHDRLVDRIATGDANAGRTRLIWGALTAAIWMGQHERPPYLGGT